MKHSLSKHRSCLFTMMTFILFGLAMTQGAFFLMFYRYILIFSSYQQRIISCLPCVYRVIYARGTFGETNFLSASITVVAQLKAWTNSFMTKRPTCVLRNSLIVIVSSLKVKCDHRSKPSNRDLPVRDKA